MADVLYICYEFPRLSETFISGEFLQLRRSGLSVRALAMSPASAQDFSPELRQLADEALCVPRPGLRRGLAALGLTLLHHPLLTLRALARLAQGEAPPNRWVAYASHLLYACHVTRAIDLSDVAVYHAHFATGPASVAMFMGLLTDRPYTVVAHAYDIYHDRMALGLKVRTAASFLTISNENREYLMDRYGAAARNVRVVHCGVDTRDLARRSANATPARPPLIVAVGRLTPKKGHDTLIRACKILADGGLPFRCIIVGGGDQAAALGSLVEKCGLAEHVRLPGAVRHDETLDLVASATAASLACRSLPDGSRDGIPVSLMEAMGMGVAVVSTRVGGIPELIEDGGNGLLVDQNDPQALAKALGDLLCDDRLRARLGAAGKTTVEELFDIEKTAAETRRVLESVAPALATSNRDAR